MRLIVGLGNPGEQYVNTRHNAGFLALDGFLGAVKWQENKKFNALIHEDGEFLFVKPLAFMNNSGQSVQKILDYYKLRPKKLGLISKKEANLTESLMVIHDDLDLPFGTYRLSTDATSAGHRGVQSIIDYLKTKNFIRLRIGIKNNLLRMPIPPEKFVLQPFSGEEKERLKTILSALNLKNLK
jgi:PTH1 family peptidyl-tRNA hydrolase